MTQSVNTPQSQELREQLARWTAAGLIDAAIAVWLARRVRLRDDGRR